MNVTQRPVSMFVPGRIKSPGMTVMHTGRRKSSRNLTPNSIQALRISKRYDGTKQSGAKSCQLAELLQQAHFQSSHSIYVSLDPFFGTVVIHVAVIGTKACGHVYSRAGPFGLMDLNVDTELFAGLPSSVGRNLMTTQAMATLFMAFMESLSKEYILRLERRSASASIAAAEAAVRVASTMELSKDPTITQQMLSFLRPKFSKILEFDVVIPQDGFLQDILPSPLNMKDKSIEVTKVPSPPQQENSEKRENLIHEIIATERTYVSRLQHLLKDYALPLRAASRKQRGILGPYETNAMFPTSLDAIVLLNQDFLKSLEATSGDFEFALTLNNAFKDFRKIYARYLETSSDLDQLLRNAMKQTKFREFADNTRSVAGANIGIRELVMEPISRIPRYSLLISSLLAAITEANPAYQLFKEALITVKRIGLMERDHAEASQEIVMKLAALVSSWPSDLVKSSLRIIAHVDCLDVVPTDVSGTDANGNTQGHLCTLILCTDRLIIVKRARNLRLDDILHLNKKNELGYRGYIMLHDLKLFDGEDSLHLVCQTEIVGVSSERWTSRPYRRMALMTADAVKFVRQINTAKHASRRCRPERFLDTYQNMQVEYHLYREEDWQQESKSKKSDFRICQTYIDSSDGLCAFVATQRSDYISCVAQSGAQSDMLAKDVSSMFVLRDAIHERALALHSDSWLNTLTHSIALLIDIHDMFVQSLVNGGLLATAGSSSKPRPTSPSKIMSSFLGRLSDGSPGRPRTLATVGRTDTDLTERSFSSHMISKKRSVPLFNFGNNDERHLQGVEAFADSLFSFEHFSEKDFTAATQAELKQINSLANTVAKDPRKSFAITGSPSKVALHAFRVYCRTTLSKKLSTPILSDSICHRLRSCHRTEADTRYTQTREIMKDLPRIHLGLLRTALKIGRHLLFATVEASRVQALLAINEILVSTTIGNSFIGTLETLLADFDHYFQVARDMNLELSVNSGLSLAPGDSRFGSLSSVSKTQYTKDRGGVPFLINSSAKESAYRATPDLVYGASSTDETSSLQRSRSGSSFAHSSNSEIRNDYKRATVHVDQDLDRYNFLAAASAESLTLNARSYKTSKILPTLPLESGSIPRSLSEQFLTNVDFDLTTSMNRTPTQTSSVLQEPQAPFARDDLSTTTGVVPASMLFSSDMHYSSSSQPRRIITPSRIPIPSPRINQSPNQTPTHSRNVSSSMPPASLTSKKTTGIPRLPSTIVKRRESQGLTKSFSNHSFDFDSNLIADFTTAMHFSSSEHGLDAKDAARLSPTLSSRSSSSERFARISHRRASREQIRRDIADDSRMSSMATIRRVSKQLQATAIGALDIRPVVEEPSTLQRIASPKSAVSEAQPSSAVKNTACSAQCMNQMESLRLELEHYKTIYRASAEEVDITLDLANEQIEQLQIAFEKGTVEATALSMLELEKEQNRKLMIVLAELREKRF